jgi:nitrite reductase/ring-hydroxylating ferredoxin subunit
LTEASIPLCELDDIPDGGARGFQYRSETDPFDLFVVRRESRLFAYRNSCPHTGGPLDWVPDQFLDVDGCWIQCATHAALFDIESGVCVAGPCAGDRLSPLAVSLVDGVVRLTVASSGG